MKIRWYSLTYATLVGPKVTFYLPSDMCILISLFLGLSHHSEAAKASYSPSFSSLEPDINLQF